MHNNVINNNLDDLKVLPQEDLLLHAIRLVYTANDEHLYHPIDAWLSQEGHKQIMTQATTFLSAKHGSSLLALGNIIVATQAIPKEATQWEVKNASPERAWVDASIFPCWTLHSVARNGKAHVRLFLNIGENGSIHIEKSFGTALSVLNFLKQLGTTKANASKRLLLTMLTHWGAHNTFDNQQERRIAEVLVERFTENPNAPYTVDYVLPCFQETLR